LIEKFSLEGIHRNNAIFNFDANNPKHWTDDKAIWMNAEYIRTMPLADLLPFVKAELKSANSGATNTKTTTANGLKKPLI
jgi:glutamyl-tRNA synthetase